MWGVVSREGDRFKLPKGVLLLRHSDLGLAGTRLAQSTSVNNRQVCLRRPFGLRPKASKAVRLSGAYV